MLTVLNSGTMAPGHFRVERRGAGRVVFDGGVEAVPQPFEGGDVLQPVPDHGAPHLHGQSGGLAARAGRDEDAVVALAVHGPQRLVVVDDVLRATNTKPVGGIARG
jgi:hypothetical protein